MSDVRLCDDVMCEKEGLYRAPRSRAPRSREPRSREPRSREPRSREPRSRESLGEYYWFCLEHVKEYNRNWNYFAGMSEGEVMGELRASERRVDDAGTLYGVGGLHSDLRADLMTDVSADVWWGEVDDTRFGHLLCGDAMVWLKVLGIERGEVAEAMSDWQEGDEKLSFVERARKFVHGRYKELAKKHHPDLRGIGSDEEFKRINEAYSCLNNLWV